MDADQKLGASIAVSGTPTLFINGRILRGIPKPWVLEQVILEARDSADAPPTSSASSP